MHFTQVIVKSYKAVMPETSDNKTDLTDVYSLLLHQNSITVSAGAAIAFKFAEKNIRLNTTMIKTPITPLLP